MTLLIRRFTGEYVRNGVNLLLLAVVPIVFVLVAADTLSDAGRLLGGAGEGSGVEIATAGWAAGFLAAIAMYFQVAAARRTDRRLVVSGLARTKLVLARLATGALLAAVASVAALGALVMQAGIFDGPRVAAGTVMFALVYLALGAIVGATVRSAVNGTVLLMFIWIIDVFFGPALSSSDAAFTRFLPTHFITLWTVNQPTGHGGPSEMAWSLLWTVASLGAAFLVVAGTSGVARAHHREVGGSVTRQLRTGLRMAGREWRRAPVLWVMLVVVPAVFIWLSDVITPHGTAPIALTEGGATYTAWVDPATTHGGTMAPMAVGSLAALAGLFIILDSRSADRRLVGSGQRIGVVLGTRMALVGLAAGLAVAASLAVTALVFEPMQWAAYIAALAVAALTYALIGVLLGPIFGRVSGTFMAFLIPFLDLGIGQSPMLSAEPAAWVRFLPGYASIRILVDAALTPGFDEARVVPIALAWIVGLALAAGLMFHRRTAPAGGAVGQRGPSQTLGRPAQTPAQTTAPTPAQTPAQPTRTPEEVLAGRDTVNVDP